MSTKNSIRPEQYLRSQGYTYFAFISYKREDEKWAVWLKKKLQSYRFPTKTCEQHSGLPEHIRPVFLDKDNMTPGGLSEQEQNEVKSAKYLIVICSKNARRDSKNLDDEIDYFVEDEDAYKRVIPFIVDDSSDPVEECFPLRLQKLCEEENIVGANVHDSGRDNAVLKVIAYMLGIKLEELESEEKRRKKKDRIIKSVVCTVLAVLLLATGYFCWDYFVPKYQYFLDYTTVYGLPQGIGELSKKQIKGMYLHYTIVSRYGKIQELRQENSSGELLEATQLYAHDRPVNVHYFYSQSGNLTDEIVYDIYGKALYQRTYSGANHKVLAIKQYSEDNSEDYSGGVLLAAHTVKILRPEDDTDSEKSNVLGYLIDYDKNGFISEIRYISNISSFSFGTDIDGICGVRYERDKFGRVTRESFLKHTGSGFSATEAEKYEIVGTRKGLASIEYRYDDFDCVEERYLGAKGQPVLGYDNVAVIKSKFKNHNLLRDLYYGIGGELILRKGDSAGVDVEYDENGFPVKQSFFGTDKKPIIISDGYASMSLQFNREGKIIQQQCFDAQGKPTLDKQGVFTYRCTIGEQGRTTKIAVFGTDDKPVCSAIGCASLEMEYDKNGNLTRGIYRDEKGNLVLTTEGFARLEKEYDESGNAIKIAFYDADGALIADENGYAIYRSEYDHRGNEVKTFHYGEDGKPVKKKSGVFGLVYEYNDKDCCVKASYFDEEENPVVGEDGYAGWKTEYDEFGRKKRLDYFDVNGESVKCKDGYASWEYEYDAYGNRIKTTSYDEHGNLTISADGYCVSKSEFDLQGNIVRERFFGTKGEPVMGSDKYASAEYAYDSANHLVKEIYYDEKGNRTISAFGYSGVLSNYDEQGNQFFVAFFGTDGKLMLNEDGYAYSISSFDERGNEALKKFYGTHKQPVLINGGYASHYSEYDEKGNRTLYIFYGLDDKPIKCINGFAAKQTEYSATGEVISVTLYDENYKVLKQW